MRKMSAFTIIELTVVIVIIAILATISVFTFTAVQKQSRDSRRESSAKVIADAVEKYYDQNGEYPSCGKLSLPNQSTIEIDKSTLVAPLAGDGVSNSISCNDITSANGTDTYSFIGDTSAQCQSGEACGSWVLKYISESDNTIVSINSRRNTTLATTDPDPDPGHGSIAPPTGLSISATLSGTNAVGTGAGGACQAGESIERRINYAQSSTTGADSWVGPQNGSTLTVPSSEGWRYNFKQHARCVNTASSDTSSWAESSVASVVRPITTQPASPVVTNSVSGDSNTWNWNATSTCPSGTTAQYRSLARDNGSYNSGWGAPAANYTSRTWYTGLTGYNYTVDAQTRCHTDFSSGPWSANGSSMYTRLIPAPSAPTAFYISTFYDSSNHSDVIDVNWAAPSCSIGTVVVFQYNTWLDPYGTMNWSSPTRKGWLFTQTYNSSDWSQWYESNSPQVLHTLAYGKTVPPNSRVQSKSQYRCKNQTTGALSPIGPVGTSAIFNLNEY